MVQVILLKHIYDLKGQLKLENCLDVFLETLIVNDESSFCEFGTSVKIDENHVSVNKPASRGDPAYFELVNFIVSSTS